MGRKSRPQHRSSISCSTSIINIYKNKKKVRTRTNKTNKQIKKLFNQLRHESEVNNSFSTLNNTVIEIDNSIPHADTQVQNVDIKPDNSLIVIDDDDLITNETPCPIHCSTPISSEHHLNEPTHSRSDKNTKMAQKFNKDIENLTKEINNSSYLTIDLTNDSGLNITKQSNTVIDLANSTASQDCLISDGTLSMSGDSDVTVIKNKRKNNVSNKQMRKFANGIAKLDSSERGKLLEYIAGKIFNGCNGPNTSKNSLHSLIHGAKRATETVEDTYIKDVILGRVSRNSIGSNIYNPERDIKNKTGLRMVVIDGSNVAMQHTKGRIFSVKGLKICIDYFVRRGHVVKAFVPHFRCKYGKSTDGKLLDQLEKQGLVVYTPSREIQGKMITSYDDRYIVQCAAEFDAVIVSCDNYRDLLRENPRWRHVIENRLLQFTWVGDMIMFPRDPLGRDGPTLENFLKHPS